jgi:uncharacterized Zn finger protein (UPF0148 family)
MSLYAKPNMLLCPNCKYNYLRKKTINTYICSNKYCNCQYTGCEICKISVYNKSYYDGSTNCAVCTRKKKQEAEDLHNANIQQTTAKDLEKVIEILKKNNTEAMLRAEKALDEVSISLSMITHLKKCQNNLKTKQVRF